MPPSHSHAGPSLTVLYRNCLAASLVLLVLTFERSKNVTRNLDYQASRKGKITVLCQTCLDSTVLQVRLYLHMRMQFNSGNNAYEGTDQELQALKILRSKPEIHEYLS